MHDAIESIDYTIPDTAEEAHFARHMMRPDNSCVCCCKNRLSQRRSVLWCVYALIGLTVSLIIGGVLTICAAIEQRRVSAAKLMLASDDVGMAWVSWTGSSLVLCLLAAGCVLIEPAAASSGIPGLIAYLNGVDPKGGKSPLTGKDTKFTSWETMLAKTIGMICSVPSGLCIGPEGPIIHISALLAHWIVIVFQAIEQKIFTNHRFTARVSEARDFLATGAACGICTAFRAPLAGVLFVVEEASSFFTTTHLEYTFIACLISYWVTWAFTGAFSGDTTVKFKQTTGMFCSYHDFVDYMFFILLGIIGGCFGALFNHIVERLNHFRVTHINKSVLWRLLEVTGICLLTGTVAIFLPFLFSCRSTATKIVLEDSAGCLNADDQFQISHGAVTQSFIENLLGTSSNSSSSKGLRGEVLKELGTTPLSPNNVVWLSNNKKYVHLHYVHAFSCDANKHKFNEMAMLWLNGGVKAVKVLLQRGFPYMHSWQVLLVFFLCYFFLASITAGISVPAGLVVPMLLIGGSYGRLVGLLALGAKKNMCESYQTINSEQMNSDVYYWSAYVRWVIRSCRMPDPGTFAIVGAASFLGGSGRITVMLATVLLELTDDASMIAPVGVCCIFAMLVGNTFNHGLYHGLIPVFNIPFLNTEPPQEARLAQIRDVMAINVICLPKLCPVSKIETLLEQCLLGDSDRSSGKTHHAFPVVTSTKDNKLVGLITRDQLKTAIYMAREKGDHVLHLVHLLKYCDRSPLTVYPHTRLSRAYSVFRKLGMRHLPVIDQDGSVVGIITRKDLMQYLLSDQTAQEVIKIKRVQRQVRLFLASKKKTAAAGGTQNLS